MCHVGAVVPNNVSGLVQLSVWFSGNDGREEVDVDVA